MDVPFTIDQFLNVFKDYNTAIWPAQLVAYLLGFAAVGLAVWQKAGADRAISGILALFWFWIGGVYHLTFFAAINKAAYLFGSLFILQGAFFLAAGAVKRELRFSFRSDGYGIAGAAFIAYAMIVYPLVGALLGHGYPYSPMFGVAPCPATIFTFGILLWTRGPVPFWLLVIPLLWSLLGFTAVIELGMVEDAGLLIASLLGTSLLLYRKRREAEQLISA